MQRLSIFGFVFISLFATTVNVESEYIVHSAQTALNHREEYCNWLDKKSALDMPGVEPTVWNGHSKRANIGLSYELYTRLWSLHHNLASFSDLAIEYNYLPPTVQQIVQDDLYLARKELAQRNYEIELLAQNSQRAWSAEIPMQLDLLRAKRDQTVKLIHKLKKQLFSENEMAQYIQRALSIGETAKLNLRIQVHSGWLSRSVSISPVWKSAAGELVPASQHALVEIQNDLVPDVQMLNVYQGLAKLPEGELNKNVNFLSATEIVISPEGNKLQARITDMSLNALLDLSCLRQSQAIQTRIQELEYSLKRDGVLESQLDEESQRALTLIRQVADVKTPAQKFFSLRNLTADSRY